MEELSCSMKVEKRTEKVVDCSVCLSHPTVTKVEIVSETYGDRPTFHLVILNCLVLQGSERFHLPFNPIIRRFNEGIGQ